MKRTVIKNKIDMDFLRAEYAKKYPSEVDEAGKDSGYSVMHNITYMFDKLFDGLDRSFAAITPKISITFTPSGIPDAPMKDYTLQWNKVETDGTVIGLWGFWLDVDSGAMLMGAGDRAAGVEIFNLYEDLRDKYQINFSNETFRLFLEQYKVGAIGVVELADKGLVYSDIEGSIIRNVILGLSKSKITKTDNHSVAAITQIIGEMAKIVNTLSDSLYYLNSASIFSKNKYQIFSCIEEFYPTFLEFLRFFISDADRVSSAAGAFNEVTHILYKYGRLDKSLDQIRRTGDMDRLDNFLFSASTMMRDSMIYDDTGRPYSKSALTILNVADLLEVQDKSDELIVACFESSDELKKVIENVGLKTYFTGARGASMSRSISNKNVVDSIKKFEIGKRDYGWAELKSKSERFPRKSTSEIQDISKTYKILGKVFDKIEELI